MARGHRLNTSIVLAAVHGLLGLSCWCARSSLHSLALFPPVPVPNKLPCFCGRKKIIKIIIVQELCESRGGRPGLSVLNSLMVSVDVKQY